MSQKSIPIAFFGTPEFSVPVLEALHSSEEFDVKVVISQPDRPAGRKLKLTPSPVKAWALEQNLPVLTPESCKTDEFIETFQKLNVEGAVVVAFGQILNKKLLSLCPHKFVNLHASLLPRWRGAAPIQRAIMEGDFETGVCLQVMVRKLDAGDIISEVKTKISEEENSLELHDRLSRLGANSIVKDLKAYFSGEITPRTQDEALATYAAKIEKNETWIDWAKSAQEVWNHIRGLAWGPGGTTRYKDKRLKIIKAQPIMNSQKALEGARAGEVISLDEDSFDVLCGVLNNKNTYLKIFTVQPESKPTMSVKDFLNGTALQKGDILGL